MTDGAAAVLLMRRDVAKKMGMKVLARIVSFAVAGVPPEIMGIGPALAIPAALKKSGLSMNDIDVFEIITIIVIILTNSYMPMPLNNLLGWQQPILNLRSGNSVQRRCASKSWLEPIYILSRNELR